MSDVIKQITIRDIASGISSTADIGAKAENVVLQDGRTVEDLAQDKQNQIQFDVMPTAGEDYVGEIYQYTGATTTAYTNGYFYKCVTDGQSVPTYSWNRVDIQPSGSGSGDMLASVYDPDGNVAEVGGIEEYIKENAPRYNVLDYGLVSEVMNPQTHTDNSAALTALIAQVPNGSIIYFPAGIYSFASGITVNKDITFIGENVEMQTAGNTFDAQHNRPHDPMTILRYIGSSSNVTMFTKSGYVDVNFLNLTFDGGNSYNVTDNWTGTFTELPFYNQLETINLVGINGLDLSVVSPGIVKNCQFWSFSGYAVKTRNHQYIESCGFFWCKKGIVTIFSDSLLHDLWFCKSGTAIYMMPKENDNFASVNLSDIWADQLIDHLVEADSSVTSAQIITSNIWVDSVGKSAFYLPEATLSRAYIQGTFGRIGMDYAGIADADRTSALAQYTDFLACGRLVYSTLELNISNVTIGKGTRANQECFSRLITTYKASFNNDHNKVTCKAFPVSKLYDSNTQPQYSYFVDTDYNGTDGNVLIYGGVNFVDGFFTYTNSPIGRVKAPSKDFLVYDRVAKKLYRSTAGDDNTAWVEIKISGNISDLSDTNITSPKIGQVLKYNGTQWVNSTEGRYNVLDYGLKGDNSTDNSDAFNALLAQVPKNSKAVIYFPVGRYRFSQPIVIRDNGQTTPLGITFLGDTASTKDYGDGTNVGCPDSTLIYTGEANTTFIKGGTDCWYFKFEGIHLTCLNGYAMALNTDPFDNTLPYRVFTSSVTKDGIIGIGKSHNLDLKNCTFTGFSGAAVEAPVHTIIDNCSFCKNKIGVDTEYDTIIRNCWFNYCGTAINVRPNNPASQYSWTTFIISDTWVDQCTQGIYTSAKTFGIWASDIQFDMFDEAAIVCKNLVDSQITGQIHRAGMMYADITDANRTTELAPYTDAIVADKIETTVIELYSNKRNIGKGNHSAGLCPSRFVTAKDGIIESSEITNHAAYYAEIIDSNMVTTLTNTTIVAQDFNSATADPSTDIDFITVLGGE